MWRVTVHSFRYLPKQYINWFYLPSWGIPHEINSIYLQEFNLIFRYILWNNSRCSTMIFFKNYSKYIFNNLSTKIWSSSSDISFDFTRIVSWNISMGSSNNFSRDASTDFLGFSNEFAFSLSRFSTNNFQRIPLEITPQIPRLWSLQKFQHLLLLF